MPYVGVEAMNHHLIEISATVSPGAVALLIMDGAGWHRSNQLVVPDNIVLLKLPPYAPELNPTENIWKYLRANALANSVWETYEAIVEACCNAWRGLIAKPEVITADSDDGARLFRSDGAHLYDLIPPGQEVVIGRNRRG